MGLFYALGALPNAFAVPVALPYRFLQGEPGVIFR